jgi:hypothetical protein
MAFVVIFAGLTLLIRIFAATDPDNTLGVEPALREPEASQDVTPPNPAREPGED